MSLAPVCTALNKVALPTARFGSIAFDSVPCNSPILALMGHFGAKTYAVKRGFRDAKHRLPSGHAAI